MVLIINLNTTVDKTHIVNNYQIEKVFRPSATLKVGGGKGINVARVLNKLKIPYVVLGFVGGVNKDFILKNFKKEKINFVGVSINGNSRDITIVVDPIRRTETVINEKGPVISLKERKKFLRKFSHLVKNVKYLAICGSMPLGMPDKFYGELIAIAKNYKVFTLLDTSGKPLIQGIKYQPDLIKLNKDEFKMISDKKFVSIKKEFVDLYNKGIKNIILTLGKKGCIGFNGEKYIKIKPPKIDKISTVGSGDAFTAGLIYSFIKNKNFTESLVFATACAAANALKIGAGVLDVRDIYRLKRKIKH